MKSHIEKLTVIQADRNDVYRDIARVHRLARGAIQEGSVCRVTVNGNSKLLVVRGVEDGLRDYIRLDLLARSDLKVDDNTTHQFTFTKVGWWGHTCWACGAADAAARVAAWIAVLSFGLGVLGVILAVWGIYLSWPGTKP